MASAARYSLMIGIPAYSSMMVSTVTSLLEEMILANRAGVSVQYSIRTGGSLIPEVRNLLVHDFLASKADRLVFVDADVSWAPGALLRLANHPADFVGGAYRYKRLDELYPVNFPDKKKAYQDPKTGLVEVAVLPTGFLCLSRDVFRRFRGAFPDRGFVDASGRHHTYFHTPIVEGRLLSEDAAFCLEWREMGGKVWMDPDLTLTHSGSDSRFTGRISDWMKKMGVALVQGERPMPPEAAASPVRPGS